jgi:hypothetical protein
MASTLQKIILLLVLFTSNTVAGQVRFTASVSPAQISKDEYAQLRLTIENAQDVDRVAPPALKDFTIVSGPSQESSTTMINGVTKSSFSLVYLIKPRSSGTFSIPSATVTVAGANYRSNPVSVKVSNTVSGNRNTQNNTNIPGMPFSMMDPFADAKPEIQYNDYILRKGESAMDKIKRNMLVRVEVNKNSCYVGEPVIATYKLYTRLKSESSVTGNPSFNGFSVIDLQQPNNMNYTNERFEGKEYNVYTIRKVQLYPLQSGNLELEPVEIENKVRFIKEEYARQQADDMNDVFRDFTEATIPANGVEDQVVALQSKPVTIQVKALPDADKPAGFKGAVGNFNLVAGLEKDNFSTDDAGKLQIVLSGEGNLQLVNNPEIQWPQGLDAFEPKSIDDIEKTTVPVSGKKLIEYPFTVTDPGSYTLPPIEFSFFDPKTAKYKTVTTKALSFTVTKGTGKVAKDTMAIVNEEKNKGFLHKVFSNRRLVVSIVAALILIGLIIWLKKDNKRVKKTKEEELAKEKEKVALVTEPVEEIISNQKNPLEEAEAHLINNDSKQFYTTLNQSFKNFLSHKLNIPQEELNKKTINERMDKKNIAIETSLQVQQLLDEIEWELYTPFSDTSKLQQVYDRTNELIQMLNTYKA